MQKNPNVIYPWRENRAEHKLVVEQHRDRPAGMCVILFMWGAILSFGLCVIGAAGYWMPMVWRVWRGVGL